jgi:mannose-6-phosphate isomerase-like protein (cupin superfamily)
MAEVGLDVNVHFLFVHFLFFLSVCEAAWCAVATNFEPMPRLIQAPTRILAHGQPPKTIEEFIGRANSQTAAVSIARMVSPSGWSETGQTPEFDEYTVVLRGELQVQTREGLLRVAAGQAVVVSRGEWVRYSTPGPEGAEYIAVCLPAFSPETVHRD